MSIFKFTEDGCVLDENGFLIAEYARWQEARTAAKYANEQLAKGEDQETIERRLRDWSLDLDHEVMADTASALHYAD